MNEINDDYREEENVYVEYQSREKKNEKLTKNTKL